MKKDDEIINQEFEVEDSVSQTIQDKEHKEKHINSDKEQENNFRETDQKPQFVFIDEQDFNRELEKTDTKSEDEEELEDKPLLKKFKTDTQKSFPCSQCGNVFTNLKILAKHKNENHVKLKKEQIERSMNDGNVQQFRGDKSQQSKSRKCEKCEKTFSSTQVLQDHIVVHHTGIYPHLCDICGKGFTVKEFKNRFQKHRKTCEANGPKIVIEKICKECDKTFQTLSQYKRHMVFHTKAKAFQCSDCEKAYADKRNLMKHVLLLHPLNATQFDRVKNNPCDLCDEHFAMKSEVALHKVHVHGESYFTSCDTCGKGFIKNDYIIRLRNHKKKCPS